MKASLLLRGQPARRASRSQEPECGKNSTAKNAVIEGQEKTKMLMLLAVKELMEFSENVVRSRVLIGVLKLHPAKQRVQ